MSSLVATLLLMGSSISTSDRQVAPTPPMGWNSWDAFGASVTEDEVKANADYMAKHLKKHGWQYVVVDIEWYEPTANGSQYHAFAKLDMDEYGRVVPSLNRFPSASGGKGFKPLSDYVHRLGLKFGIHILRGIPRQAVVAKTPVLGTKFTAVDVADTSSTCPWNTDMFGVDPAKPGGQAYYDSIFKLYKSWNVDFVKIDDLSKPYHKGEIELIRNAIDRISPHIVFSSSPGETPVAEAEHAKAHIDMWRISDDFWDRWEALRHSFELCDRWQGLAGPGHWPDADMLPLGHIGIRNSDNGSDRQTRFTKEEQVTMMSLWCIARSPLMLGGHLPDNDEWTTSLITNDEVLEVLNKSSENRQVSRTPDDAVWTARGTRGARYLALFNLSDKPRTVSADLAAIGAKDGSQVHDLWSHQDLGRASRSISLTVPSHGARLLRLKA